jgi:hypothetical protein
MSTAPSYKTLLGDDDEGVATAPIDLVVVGGSRGFWSNDVYLAENGRPRELSSISLATWSLLSTSIKDYILGLYKSIAKYLIAYVFVIYIQMFVVAFNDSFYENPAWIVVVYWVVVALLFIPGIATLHSFLYKHCATDFHESVQSVVQELRPAIIEAGFEVDYIVEDGSCFPVLCFGKNYRSTLRFIPIHENSV